MIVSILFHTLSFYQVHEFGDSRAESEWNENCLMCLEYGLGGYTFAIS